MHSVGQVAVLAVPRTVLVVDPDLALRRTVREACRRDGYQVTEAAGRRQAVAHLQVGRPSLVLISRELPDDSGLEACRELRRFAGRVAIILVGAWGGDAEVVAALEQGADDYVAKPLQARELLARLDANLRRLAAGEQGAGLETLRFGDLTIDLARRRVLRGASDVRLTHTELDLLVLLAGNPGRVLTREAALQRIWSQELGIDEETRVIDVHVRNLRRKIEAEPSRPSRIRAVPGIGYRFDSGAT